ncbi:hypothetical protein [Cecembia calidifontis]|nr:hypothetical protein [Cecembia calidifontis]
MFFQVQTKYAGFWVFNMFFIIVMQMCFSCKNPETTKSLEERIFGLKKAYQIHANHSLLIIDLDGCSTCVNDIYVHLDDLKNQKDLSVIFNSNFNKKFKNYVGDNCERCYLDSLGKSFEYDLLQGPAILYQKKSEIYDSIPYPNFKEII